MKARVFTLMCLFALSRLMSVQPAFGQCSSSDPSSPEGITPTLVAGNPPLCTGGFRIDPPVSGTFDLDAFGNQVTVTISSSACGEVFSWSASDNVVMDQVIAKGGPNANRYDYTGQNHPNPFNPSTTFTFDLPQAGHVKLVVFTTSGQKIAKVAEDNFSAGRHSITWKVPRSLGSGVYIYRLEAGSFTSVKRMLYLK